MRNAQAPRYSRSASSRSRRTRRISFIVRATAYRRVRTPIQSAGQGACDSVGGILKGEESVSGDVNPQQIAVLGLGYVGCVTAACLAHIGHRVVGVDRDPFKVESVMAGRAPFFEPGLEELVTGCVQAGRLSATVLLADALASADVALICVGT